MYSTSLCFIVTHQKMNVNFYYLRNTERIRANSTKNTVSYIDSSRRLHPRRRREDVYNRRPGDRVRSIRKRSLWLDLLDNNFILNVGAVNDRPFFAFLTRMEDNDRFL